MKTIELDVCYFFTNGKKDIKCAIFNEQSKKLLESCIGKKFTIKSDSYNYLDS
jgi:hypothetical protein